VSALSVSAGARYTKAREFLKIPRVGIPPGRDIGVDALRGFSILLVVLGHAIANAENLLPFMASNLGNVTAPTYNLKYVLSNFLYTFHMPLFFLISGYVLFGKRIRIRDRALRLLVPFLAWIPVYFLVNRYIHHWPAGFLTVLKDNVLHPAIGLWFLPTLFLCSLLLIPVRYLENRETWMGEASLGVLFVVVNLLPVEILGVMQVKYFFAFFAVGYLAHKHRSRINRIDRERIDGALVALSALFMVLFTALFYYGRNHPFTFPISLPDLFKTPSAYVVRYAMAALGIVFSIAVVRALKAGRGRAVFAWFGLVTMDIYVANFLMLQLAFGGGWLKVLVSFVSGIFLPLVLSFLVLRQWWVTGALFLGIKPDRRADRTIDRCRPRS
jgi:fucose 4-O-acetylase-like acetyltransferase